MKRINLFLFLFLILWVLSLYFTFTPTLLWYAYFFVSTITILIIMRLLAYLDPNLFTKYSELISLLFHKNNNITKIEQGDPSTTYEVAPVKTRIDTRSDYIIIDSYNTNMRHKEYLHTSIPDINKEEKQRILFETILTLKEANLFPVLYAGLDDDDLINHFNEYKNRKIFELYDNIIPNAYAKSLFDSKRNINRLNIFIPNNQNRDSDHSLGFIDIEDNHKAELLLTKYSNVQVIPTILGGAYKEPYQDENSEIYIKTGFIPYNLTISLAFYNV